MPPKRVPPTTLDCEFKQVLLDFFDDENGMLWHHRLLLVRGEPGVWVVATPTLGVQVCKLADHRVLPLGRKAPFPPELGETVYHFEPIAADVLADLRVKALALANIMGFALPVSDAASEGTWLLADPVSPHFGSEVPPEALSAPEACVTRGACGLVQVDGEWAIMERTTLPVDEWKLAKWSGPGRDPRIACHHMVGNRRFISETDAIAHWTVSKKPESHPLLGPLVTREWFMQLQTSGMSLTQYDQQWRLKSGVSELSTIAKFHTALVDALRYMITIDQLDPSQLVSAELLTRDVVRIEHAVARNPKQPDWDGLDVLTSASVSNKGSMETPTFTSWLSTHQRDAATVLKQQRLLREEREAELKRKKQPKGKGKEAAEGE